LKDIEKRTDEKIEPLEENKTEDTKKVVPEVEHEPE
jgi:hypothetical protein